ncbi:hypothetical protein [Sphingomonas faeni]|uniref:hypothetical protein n=1 Tax=Sphingomonas faeni TaxID=185950 RepID=UPI00336500C4
MLSVSSEKELIDQWLNEEAVARVASDAAADLNEQDEHYIAAERLADRAWSLTETNDHPFIASNIWR